jgi:hypothetical protein
MAARYRNGDTNSLARVPDLITCNEYIVLSVLFLDVYRSDSLQNMTDAVGRKTVKIVKYLTIRPV